MSYQGNTGCSCGGGGSSSGGGSGGGTTVVCSRPSIPVAVPGMCLADGTPIAIISTRAKDGTWVRTGWLNLSTGGFTAGAPPASATPCNPNDNGGGDEPATLAGVHVEDWCDVDADGNVLSPVLAKYTVDDAGAITGVEFLTPDGEPYEVQGTLGICNTDGPADLAGRELVRLCDVADDGTITVFVRDYERDSTGAVTGFTDYDIDGQPYTPSGEVTSCDTAQPEDECASPTTPLATTGLCLADGTPIATVATRDCDGVVSTDGWINLLTNTYTAGQPPAGARACGETSAFDVSGVLCDVNADGDVLGLVLIEVERGTDGEITGTRLINAADGSEYTLQGELTVCPAGVDQPERDLIELCDLTDDGEGTTATRFLRDYARDENGAITGYTDYTLDGQPYTPTGEVASCDDVPVPEEPAQPERDLIRLCDSVDEGEDTTVTVFVRDYERDDTGAIVSYSDYDLDGQPYTPVGEIGACEEALEVPTREHDLVRLCDTIDAGEDVETVEFIRDYERDPNGQIVGHSDYTLDGLPYEPQGEVGQCRDTEERCEPTPEVDAAPVVLCDTIDDGEGEQVVPFLRSYQIDNDSGTITGHTDTELDGSTPYEPVGSVGVCSPTGDEQEPQDRYEVEVVPLCVLDADGEVVRQVLVEHVYDTATGERTETRNVDPVTGEPVELAEGETIGQCVEPCRDTQTMLLCDLADDGEVTASTQFMRNVVVDCETGETISTRDTTLDGQPYEVTGEVGQCQPANSGADPLPEFDVAPIVLCDTIDGGEDVETVEFLRSYRVDNTTGVITGYTDTTLDGDTPYTPQGEVRQCQGSNDTPTPDPEPRVDVETDILCVLDADGARVREVRVERVYDDQTGVLTEQRVLDPTTDEPYTLADGETIGSCQECPVAFSTECVAVVDRSMVSYDNTSLINGVPGRCGSVQGPVDVESSGASFGCNGGPYQITSWIIDGVEVVTGEPKTFVGGPCGPGTADNPGMHTTWANALTNLDPHGAWEVDTMPGCAWYVRSDAPRPVEYGPMVIEGPGQYGPGGTWTLGPVQSCEETHYTKVYSRECDGQITVSWLDAQGNPTDPPTGELVPCGTGCRSSGGGGCCDEPSLDVRCREHILCDTGPDGDDPVSFMRTICRDSNGNVVSVTDTELDAVTPYTVRS